MKKIDLKIIEEDNKSKCKCFNPPFNYKDYNTKHVGIDKTNGRYGEVTIETCIICGNKWLKILIEDEGFTGSGRWCKGLITDKIDKSIEPKNTEKILESLEWYFIGGSYYNSSGCIAYNKFSYDL